MLAGTHWKKDDWSILVLNFSRVAGGAQVDLVQIGAPALRPKRRAQRLAEVLLAAVEEVHQPKIGAGLQSALHPRRLASANKLNNFQAITRGQASAFPLSARKNL